MNNKNELIIEAGRTESHYWKDLWRYRELFYFLAWRDILVRYKQTAIGIIWALLYGLVEVLIEGSFSGNLLNVGGSRFWDLIYFSFVTLTTLGYGDILPMNSYARTLAYIEAIAGQFYIAILVASLVGAHLSDRQAWKE